MAELPVLEVVATTHLVCDLTLGLGEVVHDYLAVRIATPGLSSAREAIRMIRASR